MKKIFTTISILMAVVSASVVLTSWNDDDQTLNSSGAPVDVNGKGYSGDPFGGNLDCTTCHNDGSASNRTGMITSNIPGTGYVAGNTYTITATVVEAGITKFGFQCTPQNASGTLLGTLTPIGTTETQLKGSGRYITHKGTSTTGSGSRSWSFQWTAPATGLGPVTFYGAFNAADGDFTDLGDQIFLSTTVVSEFLNGIGIPQLPSESSISIYPTVSNEQFTVAVGSGSGNQYNLEIYNVAGEKVYQSQISSLTSHLSLDVPNGLYFVWLKTENSNTFRKIVVQ